MIRAFVLSVCLSLSATSVLADWVHRPSEHWDDVGDAFVRNSAGDRLTVSCGNSGEAGFELSLAGGHFPEGYRRLYFVVDGGGSAMPVFMQCDGQDCASSVDHASGHGAWERHMAEKAQVMKALRRGNQVDILDADRRKRLASFTLAGSSAALNSYRAAQAVCDGL